ncbi:MAG: glucose-6-phosphate dehydrogenase [Candidatus Saccharimonadales bacterium]
MTDIPNLGPAFLIIFGITGDLAKKKLLPALYSLLKEDLLPQPFEIIGISRRDFNIDTLLEEVELCINERDNVCDPKTVAKLKKALTVFQMDVTKAADYDRLLLELNSKEDAYDTHLNRLYYLSIPPQVFGPIVRLLGEHGHNASCQHGAASTRLLVEKPFGYDVKSAKQLIEDLSVAYGDAQVFRIDHYLAKETVQNILTFRFKNPLFEKIWDAQHISRVTITAYEKIGIEGRVNFYEQTGAMRDLIQSHLLQLLALVTMEPPASMASEDIHAAKLAALDQVLPIAPDKVATRATRGQYRSYRKEVGDPASRTETFARLHLQIENNRWRGVPIIVQTGKALAEKITEITLAFHAVDQPTNRLHMRLQPNEGINLVLQAKLPGLTDETQEVVMNFDYREAFDSVHPDAYERVLVDALRGDATLFSTSQEVLASWRIIENVLNTWAKNDAGLELYNSGSTGSAIGQSSTDDSKS